VLAVVSGKQIFLQFDYFRKKLRERVKAQIKACGGKGWDDEHKVWGLKLSVPNIRFVISEKFALTDADVDLLLTLVNKSFGDDVPNIAERRRLATAVEAPAIAEVACKFAGRKVLSTNEELVISAYQWVPVHYMLATGGRMLLCDDQGLGKTIEAILCTLHPEFEKPPVLIVTPVMGGFQDELLDKFGLYSWIIDRPLNFLVPGFRYYICNYQRLKFINVEIASQFFYIFDESHNLKTRGAVCTTHARDLTENAKYIIEMTGTPVLSRPKEMYPQLEILDRKIMSQVKFANEFCDAYYANGFRNTDGASNLGVLHNFAYDRYIVRRTKENPEIKLQLPEKMRHVVHLDDQKLFADSVLERFVENAQIKAADAQFIEWMRTAIDCADKSIVFCHHDVLMKAFEDLCNANHFPYLKIDGTIPQEDRSAIAKRFNEDKTIKTILLKWKAAGTGWNLQAAWTVICAELWWTPGVIVQGEDRAHRRGQKNAVLSLFPCVTKFERSMLKRLLAKMSIIKKIHGEIHDSTPEAEIQEELAKEFGIPVKPKKKAS